MTCSCRWFIQPETAISRNWNGSRTLWVFKAHYREHGATAGNHRRFMQIQYSGHTGWGCGRALVDRVSENHSRHRLRFLDYMVMKIKPLSANRILAHSPQGTTVTV